MFSESDEGQIGWLLGLVLAVSAGVLALSLVLALQHGGDRLPAAPRPQLSVAAPPILPVLLPAVAPVVLKSPPLLSAQAISDAASITVEYGVVKFYFASGQDELAAGASAALVDVVKGARGGKRVIISGFHDVRGNAAANAELATRRAQAVRAELVAAGVDQSQIRIEKPAQLAGSGNDAEARRVEIMLR